MPIYTVSLVGFVLLLAQRVTKPRTLATLVLPALARNTVSLVGLVIPLAPQVTKPPNPATLVWPALARSTASLVVFVLLLALQVTRSLYPVMLVYLVLMGSTVLQADHAATPVRLVSLSLTPQRTLFVSPVPRTNIVLPAGLAYLCVQLAIGNLSSRGAKTKLA